MKRTGVCPKCSSTEIRVLRKRKTAGNMIPIRRNVFGAVYGTWFICVSCGFVEMWVEDNDDLAKIRDKVPVL